MSGAILPLPQYAFMAWCLFKAQGQLYLYLLNYSIDLLLKMKGCSFMDAFRTVNLGTVMLYFHSK
jgi:hypothetical protein